VQLVGRPFRVRFNGTAVPIACGPATSRTVQAALRDFAPDVVHVHEPFAPSASMLATLHAAAPVVATFHAYRAPGTISDRIYRAAAPLLLPVWHRLAARIAVSQAAASCATSRMPAPARGDFWPRIVPNGVDVDVFARARPAALPPGRRLLFVGRLDLRKGFRFAVAAFAELARRYPDVTLVTIGEGRDREALDQLDPGARARVHMLGHVSAAALPTYYAAADVFLAPATGGESFGIVLAEAMSAGVPVVASDVAGYREVVRSFREGLLVPPRDPAALAHAVAGLLDTPALAHRLGEGGRARARAFAWERVAARVEQVYREVLERSRASAA
jgi:phosphatidylinositol alpha-mannosyltransferase